MSSFLYQLNDVLQFSIDFLGSIFPEDKKTEYDSSFASPSEIFSSSNKGFAFGNVSLSLEHSFRNTIVYGGSGSGKSSKILINSAIRMMGHSSIFFNDPSQELYNLVAKALHKEGYAIKILNYAKPQFGGYNPLTREGLNITEIKKISKLLIQNSLGQSSDNFWNLSAESLLSLLIQYIVKYAAREYKTFYNVVQLLNCFAHTPKLIDKAIIATKDELLLSEYKKFVSYDSKVLINIVSTISAALDIFNDPDVALATSYDSIGTIEEFRNQKTAIFIQNSIPNLNYYAILTSLFVSQMLSEIMQKVPSKKELPIFFLLDECSSLSLQNILPIAISNVRKYHCGMCLIFQSPFQLIQRYGAAGAKAIEDNTFVKAYLPSVDIQTAGILEQTFGKFEFEDERKGKHLRSLMTTNEIREESEHAFLICSGHRAMKMKLKPFYEQSSMKRYTNLPILEQPIVQPFDRPPILRFDI